MEKIYSECPQCIDGVETISNLINGEPVFEEIICRRCEGSKQVSNLSLSDDFIDRINDMWGKINDIFEKLYE